MKRVLLGLYLLVALSVMFSGCGKVPADELMSKGGQLESEGMYEEAIDQYRKILKSNSPLCAEAQYKIALVQANGLQNFDDAIVTFENVITKYPDTKFAPQAQFMTGFIYANSTSEIDKAKAAYEKFLEKYPEHELVESVNWELKYLGKDINEIPELMNLESDSTAETASAE
jgi:outer membrane protein assembly factor BamD (BamD/ComL family)